MELMICYCIFHIMQLNTKEKWQDRKMTKWGTFKNLLVQMMKFFIHSSDTQKLLLSFNLLWGFIQSFNCQWWDSFIIFLNFHNVLKNACGILFSIFPYLKTSAISRSSGICYCVNFILFNFITENTFHNRMALELPENYHSLTHSYPRIQNVVLSCKSFFWPHCSGFSCNPLPFMVFLKVL